MVRSLQLLSQLLDCLHNCAVLINVIIREAHIDWHLKVVVSLAHVT